MKYGLKQFRKDFPTEQACLGFIFETLHTPECACGGSYALREGRRQYQCSRCRLSINPLVGTIFERSVVSLTQWFSSMLLVHQGISIKGLQRELGTTYKTAWRCAHILREAMRGDTIDLICRQKDGRSITKKIKKPSKQEQRRGVKRTPSVSESINAIETPAPVLKFFLGTQKAYQDVPVAERKTSGFFRLTT